MNIERYKDDIKVRNKTITQWFNFSECPHQKSRGSRTVGEWSMNAWQHFKTDLTRKHPSNSKTAFYLPCEEFIDRTRSPVRESVIGICHHTPRLRTENVREIVLYPIKYDNCGWNCYSYSNEHPWRQDFQYCSVVSYDHLQQLVCTKNDKMMWTLGSAQLYIAQSFRIQSRYQKT